MDPLEDQGELRWNNDIYYNDLGGELCGRPGWYAYTGLRSIDGVKLLAALPGQQPSCTAGCGYPLCEQGKGLGLQLSLV